MELYSQIDAYLLRLIRESTPERTAWNIEKIRQGKPTEWKYMPNRETRPIKNHGHNRKSVSYK